MSASKPENGARWRLGRLKTELRTCDALANHRGQAFRERVVSSYLLRLVKEDFTFTTGWDANQNKLPDEWELAKWGNTRFHYPIVDEDGDGAINILEYALDRDPRKSDAANTPAVTIDQDGHLSMTVTKRPHVMLEVEASTDLVSWIPAIVIAETDSTVTAREEFPASTPGGRFLRVRVTSE